MKRLCFLEFIHSHKCLPRVSEGFEAMLVKFGITMSKGSMRLESEKRRARNIARNRTKFSLQILDECV